MKYAFYITNHGFGHASRNVPIIQKLLAQDSEGLVYIKSDRDRCEFLKRNLGEKEDRIQYFEDCTETGLILKTGKMEPDIENMRYVIEKDFLLWDMYIQREKDFMKRNKPDIIIADVICWAIKAAHDCGIKTLLIGNFSWAQMYKSFYDSSIWEPYIRYYKLADKAIWYEIHAKELEDYCSDYECVSMVSRAVNEAEVKKIRSLYKKPIVFVSLGASAELEEKIDVEELPYDFVITRGVDLKGSNVHVLPLKMINTPDYIAAADYVIAKGGWSTVAEILLQGKKCALLFRGNNSEDDNTRLTLEARNQCVSLYGNELSNIKEIIKKIGMLNPKSYDIYSDDTQKICDIIIGMIKNKREVLYNDSV
ncbi:MAG: hypothetical protein NC428_00715 [Clostridium sp.]|nr:hypothetical protein [Clostridium sp.]